MAINFPENRKEISTRVKSDVKGQLPESNPYLRNSFLQAIIFGLSGRLFDIYQLAKTLLRNLFWDTAEGEYLERPAAYFGISRLSATGSTGKISAEGTAPTSIPLGTSFQNSSGQEFQTTLAGNIVATSISVTTLTQTLGLATATTSSEHGLAPGISFTISGAVETEYNISSTVVSVLSETQFQYAVDSGATSPATGTILAAYDVASLSVESIDQGSSTNIEEGDELTLTNPIAGVNDSAFAQFEGLQGGTNLETDEALRERFLFRVQNPVALFNKSAIETQARSINGVTRVFVFGVDETVGTISASTLTQAGGVAIFTASANHNLLSGQKASITGAIESGYNVSSRRIIVINATQFAYVTDGTPTSPATGTPIASGSIVEEGQVKVFFTRDNDDDIIPSASEVATVKDEILTIKPAHMSDDDVSVKAPAGLVTNYVFSGISPDTSTMRTAIEARLLTFYQEGTTIGQDILKTQYDTTITGTIDPETGERLESFALTSPTGNISIDSEEIGVLGELTF